MCFNATSRFALDSIGKATAGGSTGDWSASILHLCQLLAHPFGEIISCSPERLLEVRGKALSTRPIAGTRPRGLTAAADQRLESELLLNSKERAEHVMLVDLERNDLGRVSQPGSVQVDELMAIERYSHVMHIVSNVVGRLQPGCNALDAVRAVYPGGTITGCPKVRCMELIERLEPVRRSLFYGSAGYLDCTGDLDLNILIRTLLKSGSRVWGQVGAGIVADSDPKANISNRSIRPKPSGKRWETSHKLGSKSI